MIGCLHFDLLNLFCWKIIYGESLFCKLQHRTFIMSLVTSQLNLSSFLDFKREPANFGLFHYRSLVGGTFCRKKRSPMWVILHTLFNISNFNVIMVKQGSTFLLILV